MSFKVAIFAFALLVCSAQSARIQVRCPRVDHETPTFLADPYDCSKYYECSNGIPIHMSCPSGLMFDLVLNVCNYVQNVQCGFRPVPYHPENFDGNDAQ